MILRAQEIRIPSLKQGGAERPTWTMKKEYWEAWVQVLVRTLT